MRHVPWILAAPAIALAIVFRFLPTVFGVGYSFTDWAGITLTANNTGFQNYITIFTDTTMRASVWHTLLIAGLMVLFSNIIGLMLAIVLRNKFKLRNIYRALFFLPFSMSYLATGYIWQFILSYDGPFNQFLVRTGLAAEARPWLADPQYAIFMVAIVMIWQYTGLTLVIYLSGLEGIPEELEDAVAMDGASRWLKFRKVTLPLLAPAITVAFTLTMVWGLASFDQIISLTGGGPVGATETLATNVYRTTFKFGMYGLGSALAVILTLVIAAFAIMQNALLRGREESL